MKRGIVMCVWMTAALFVAATFADEGKKQATYKALQLHRFGLLKGNLDGVIHLLSEGVKMTLIAESKEDNIDVEAETVTLFYDEEGESMPTHVVFEQDVVFTHEEGTIRADKATLDFGSQEAVFTGNATADFSVIRGAKAESILMNLETGDVVAKHGSVRELILRDPDEEASNGNRN